MKKSECIESQYYADEYFTYGEDGAIYDRDTGEKVARWDESQNSAHVQELYDNWSAETNDPETQEWRDELSSEELAQVEKWDDRYEQQIAKMAFDILSLEAKKKEAMKNISFYRIVRDPEESWKPYRSEPMYDGEPELGSHQSTYGLSSPKAGDYLVTDQTGTSVRTASDRDFEDVRFSAMPPLDEMISTGMVMRVPQQLMDQDLTRQDQIQNITDKMAERRQHMDDVKDHIADLHSEPTSEAKSENMRNAMEELQKTQTDIAELEGQLLNLEEEYQRFSEEHFFKKVKEPAREKGGKSLAELMKSAHDYVQTHTQRVQSKTMVENRGKIR